MLAVNGEIYNHQELQAQLARPYAFQTASDCEVILALYEERGDDFLNMLNGIFAFVLYDEAKDSWLIARDPIGIIPLYVGTDEDGTLHVASELKALEPVCREVAEFPPGHLWTSDDEAPRRWWRRDWQSWEGVASCVTDRAALTAALDDAVRSHLMCDVPYGVLLSGGLDSSVIAALAARHAAMRVGGRREIARLVAAPAHLRHRPRRFARPGRRARGGRAPRHGAPRVQLHDPGGTRRAAATSSATSRRYDVTTIRASTPMYLMARRIKAMGIKMVLSGEGSDEIFGGYLYFHKAPDARERSTRRRCASSTNLHLYDCLRANKSMAAWGVEARVPFLDREFLDVAMAIDAGRQDVRRRGIEKQVLREAFAGALPDAILWRQKEQFSDGVGYGWIDALKATAEQVVDDEVFAERAAAFPLNTPVSKEAYFYRAMFEQHFGGRESVLLTVPYGKSVACSTEAALAWDASLRLRDDPSGRAVGVHEDAYDGGKPGA